MTRHRRRIVIPAVTSLAAAAGLLLPAAAYAGPPNGCANASQSDFNGDGYEDAVVGDPYATVNGKTRAELTPLLIQDAG